jgi:sugar/nucleoside kinase (ribokinase family)
MGTDMSALVPINSTTLPALVAAGITAYLKNGGTLEKAAAMANHASTRTTQLYDRRHDEVSLDEVERIVI